MIPTKSKRAPPTRPSTGRPTGARNRVERLINRLKQFRRIATRYEKRAVNYARHAHHRHEPALALTFAGTP